jgi:hypothetical protein
MRAQQGCLEIGAVAMGSRAVGRLTEQITASVKKEGL